MKRRTSLAFSWVTCAHFNSEMKSLSEIPVVVLRSACMIYGSESTKRLLETWRKYFTIPLAFVSRGGLRLWGNLVGKYEDIWRSNFTSVMNSIILLCCFVGATGKWLQVFFLTRFSSFIWNYSPFDHVKGFFSVFSTFNSSQIIYLAEHHLPCPTFAGGFSSELSIAREYHG